ncbi:hydrolase [Paractinoplanes deccanensis]|uniref:Hydrolase n=1 Tax=Paractinoplanes deccanensis TaxID=113561 RepID=A0ABQ3Y5X9_9ACTN|nr:alpha/beta hydrolase [Actinoplanes deccanensis]GID75392.1 hydrolase [Actinoplanes deccanensis]
MEQSIQNHVEVDGSWVTVDVYGDPDGPAIVLIPGAMADAAAWAAVAQHLEGWQSVAVVNRRGRHPSGPLTDAYGLETEIADAAAVMRRFTDVRTLFGWSYGALIALHLTNTLAVPQLIAYEPVMAPFGAGALPDLHRAHAAADYDRSVEVALRQVTGMDAAAVDALRSHHAAWAQMRRLSPPIYAETRAINQALAPERFAVRAARVDLIVGELNQDRAPYGTSFNDVARHVPHATVHQLTGQGHLAHLQAPQRLATLVNRLAA